MKKRGCYIILILLLVFCNSVLAGSFLFKASGDKLEIEEKFGDVIGAVTKTHLPELKSFQVQTDGGTSNVNQYIRFKDLTNAPRISFQENEQDEVSDFLYIPTGAGPTGSFFEYELEFEEGFISDISQNALPDYDGELLYIFDQEYKVVDSLKDGNSIKLTFATGSVTDLLPEGGTKTYSMGNNNYQIDVLTIDSDKSVRFKVNGVELNKLSKSEIVILDGGAILGVSDVLSSSTQAQDMVEIFFGGKVLAIKDNDYTDNNFNQDVEINKNKVEDGHVRISASQISDSLKITKINYRYAAKKNLYVKNGEKLSDYLSDKTGLFANWDIKYGGIEDQAANDIRFNPTGNSEYTLVFKNKDGATISVPFISNKNGTFKLGDEDQDLIIQEGSPTSFNVDKNDYFVLTSRNDKTGSTYILKYDSIDINTNTTYFTDLATNTQKSMPVAISNESGVLGEGTLSVGSISAKVIVSTATNNPIAVDLNGNNAVDGTSIMDIVTYGGGILDLSALSGSTYQINLKTESSQFEENASDENIQFTIEARSGNKIGIQLTFSGISVETATDHTLGLSNYGVEMDMLDTATDAAETLTFKYPTGQRFANVFLETGQSESATITSQQVQSSCSNNILDGDETGIDCGGSCPPCSSATCSDGIQNQNETGIDCGGPCQSCQTNISAGPECLGCMYTNDKGQTSCINAGTRVGSLYCDIDKTIKAQKNIGEACGNDYECKINMCENKKCGKHISSSLIIINILILLGLGTLVYFVVVKLLR